MSLAPGARLGPYEIIAAIGAGGMGEVYRARDPRLGRDVAIKVLPVSFSADADRLRRFEQEARAAAALNHPNILAVFDIGTHESAPYVVSELLEGETLRERLSHGALPTRKAIDDAIQIAHGLAAAHEKGIVHRDLKPENIFITNDGRLKILDFGLAKLTETDQMLSGASNVPTTPHFETEPGMLLGTMGYMAPEQLRGLSVDHRADIFAFGVILYEMLAGHRAFQGATVVDTITAILKEDPQDLPIAERHIPPALTRIIDRCLEKSASARFKSADDLAFALECLSAQSDVATVVKTRSRWVSRERIAWTLVAALLAVFVASLFLGGIGHVRATGAAEPPEMRLQIATPVGSASTAFAISPDGRKLAFLTTNQLWLRLLDSETAQPLAGTNGLQLQSPPFWSPDSQSIGFFAAGQLKRIDIAGGVVRTLAPAPTSRGGSWNSEGTILFAPSATGPLYRVPAAGGNATEATHAQPPRQTGHRFPHFLPDGRHFLFFAVGTPENQGIYLGALDSTDVRRLLDANSAATFVPPNYLLFARQETLLAQRFDLDKLELAGAPEPVAAQVAVRPGGIASVALSSSAGLIAYRPGAGERQLVWFDRTGRQTGTLSAPDAAQPGQIRLSPDGGTVALHRTSGGNTDVWLIETARGVVRRFTTDPASEFNPIWSPDGSRVVFTSDRNGGLDDLYEKVVDGSASETVLLASPEFKDGTDWSSDGRFILYGAISPVTGVDLWALPLFGDRKPFVVARTAFTENWGRFSPDSRWIVYQSDETGRPEIYVQPFPGPGGKLQISTDGGAFPEWRRDGRELFYVSRDSRLMAVPVTLNGTKVTSGTPMPLFSMPSDSEYAVSADGQRFLVNLVSKEAPPITVLLNWAGLKK